MPLPSRARTIFRLLNVTETWAPACDQMVPRGIEMTMEPVRTRVRRQFEPLYVIVIVRGLSTVSIVTTASQMEVLTVSLFPPVTDTPYRSAGAWLAPVTDASVDIAVLIS